MIKTGFIGAGKVGFSLGKFFSEGEIQVTGYYDRHRESAQEAAEFTNSKCYDSIEEIVRSSDAIFLTVPDGLITEVYESLKDYDIRNKHICHCSGAMSAGEAFPGIGSEGAEGYSIHPLFPVSNKLTVYRELGDAFFCIEGTDEAGLMLWKQRLEALGPKVQMISGEKKSKYHAACAISSNLVCALIDKSVELLQDCGFTEEGALEALEPLVMSNVKHLVEDGAVKALTGPLERGDAGTIKKHLSVIGDTGLYVEASKRLISIASKKNPDRDYSEIRELLKKE